MLNAITTAGVSPTMEPPSQPTLTKPASNGFVDLIDNLLSKVNLQQGSADQAVRDLATGKTDNLHGVMLEVAKADLSFRLFMEIRNRLTDALQEVLRMQV